MAMPHNISCQVWIVVIAQIEKDVCQQVFRLLSFCSLSKVRRMAVLDSFIGSFCQLFWIFKYVFQLLLFTKCFGWIVLFCYASLGFIHWSPRFLLISFFFSSCFHLSPTYLSYVWSRLPTPPPPHPPATVMVPSLPPCGRGGRLIMQPYSNHIVCRK